MLRILPLPQHHTSGGHMSTYNFPVPVPKHTQPFVWWSFGRLLTAIVCFVVATVRFTQRARRRRRAPEPPGAAAAACRLFLKLFYGKTSAQMTPAAHRRPLNFPDRNVQCPCFAKSPLDKLDIEDRDRHHTPLEIMGNIRKVLRCFAVNVSYKIPSTRPVPVTAMHRARVHARFRARLGRLSYILGAARSFLSTQIATTGL